MKNFARLLFGRLLITAILMVVPALVCEVKAEDARVRGEIRAVDLSNRTVAIHTRRGATVVLNTNESTVITRNGGPARLNDLRQGDGVEAGFDTETLLATQIVARGEVVSHEVRIEGVVEAVDTEASTLTIFPREGAAVTLHVSPNTQITLDGRPARLGDLLRGFPVGASYNDANFEALRIAAEGLSEVRGIVRDVGLAQGTLTIAVGDRTLTLFVAPYTSIALNGRPATLEDLRRGYQVVASYFPTSLVAGRINADSLAEIAGHIRNIEGTVLTITPLVEGTPVQLFISHNTQITINGEPATYDQLRAGMAVRAVYDITSFVAAKINAEGGSDECTLTSIAGTIGRVGDDSIAVNLAEGTTPVILSVNERTQITVNGEAARLADLQTGMRVEARFCRNTLVATVIAARRPRAR
jgi:Cu/Ag efflux protein CusF